MTTNFTAADLASLEAAIASGAMRVQYADKAVTYRSLDDMQRTRRLMQEALGVSTKRKRTVVATYRSGVR